MAKPDPNEKKVVLKACVVDAGRSTARTVYVHPNVNIRRHGTVQVYEDEAGTKPLRAFNTARLTPTA